MPEQCHVTEFLREYGKPCDHFTLVARLMEKFDDDFEKTVSALHFALYGEGKGNVFLNANNHIELVEELELATVDCIACGKSLLNLATEGYQPSGGLAFQTSGHYGSTFDPMDGSTLEIVVCDDCVNNYPAHRYA
jgi:hypothetical protein